LFEKMLSLGIRGSAVSDNIDTEAHTGNNVEDGTSAIHVSSKAYRNSENRVYEEVA